MRSGVFLGMLALFVAVSYVPPGEGKQVAMTKTRTASVRYAGTQTDVSAALEVLISALNVTATKATSALNGVKSMDVSIGEAAVNGIENAALEGWQLAKSVDPDTEIRRLFAAVDWAKGKHDIQACHALSPFVLDERIVGNKKISTPLEGDWLAFCLARVTQEEKRCDQISQGKSPDLRMLCDEELR